MNPREQIEILLSEPTAEAEERERSTFAAQLTNTDGSVVLFGAGRLGRLCARALRCGGVLLRAFCDGKADSHGTFVEGVEVLSPGDAALRFGNSSLFVVAIWTGTARENMLKRIGHLRELGCRKVVPFPALVWAYGREEIPFHSFDLPSRVLAHRAELTALGGLLTDEISARAYECELLRRLRGKFSATLPTADQYFPRDLIESVENETFVDGGAYTGDTLVDFLRFTGGRFTAYYGVEADAANATRLRETISGLPNEIQSKCTVHEWALHNCEEILNFSAAGSTTSQLVATGAHQVRGMRLDEFLGEQRVSFLKLDVEGAELEALIGAVKSLRREQPIAAVCVYHSPAHLWSVPLTLYEQLPRHRFALRCHGQDGWESVCYVIPESRYLLQ